MSKHPLEGKQLYQHYNSGDFYFILDKALIQIDDEWVDAVIYSNESGLKFVRSQKEFDAKFVKL